MVVMIVDGQGGGVGRALVAALRAKLPAGHTIRALGTNSAATAAMLRAGADEAATGEHAIVHNAPRADVIAGPIGIVLASSLLGELTPAMAAAIAGSDAQKVLLPMERCQTHVVGAVPLPLGEAVDRAADLILSLLA